jgi:hypothetical protein
MILSKLMALRKVQAQVDGDHMNVQDSSYASVRVRQSVRTAHARAGFWREIPF